MYLVVVALPDTVYTNVFAVALEKLKVGGGIVALAAEVVPYTGADTDEFELLVPFAMPVEIT